MKCITFESPIGKYAKGQTVELDDGIADAYLDTKTAKLGTVPAALQGITLGAEEMKSITTEVLEATIKRMAPQGKRFINGEMTDIATKTPEWATARRSTHMKHFQNTDEGRETAFRFGNFMAAIAYRSLPGCGHLARNYEWCQKNGIQFEQDLSGKAQSEGVNQAGGFIVFPEFDSQMIDLREKFGIFRKSIAMTRMTSDTLYIPRRLNGCTAYFTGENTAITTSQVGLDQVQLVAKKLACLVPASNELFADAMMNVGDWIAGEIAYQFALKEDQCGFLGNGTSAYGGITGVCSAIFNLNATKSNILGLQVGVAGTASDWTKFLLSDFNALIGKLPQFASDGGNARWYTSKQFWGSTMQRLATAAGGNQVADIVNGVRQLTFLGEPVTISQVFPNVAAANQVVAIYGDLGMACSFGDRMSTAIAMTNTGGNSFANDQTLIRGTERFDIVVHDVGQSTGDVPRDPNVGLLAGPMVALATAAS